MDFISNSDEQKREMLEALGLRSSEDLFDVVPKALFRCQPESDDGISELEVLRLMEAVAARNSFPHSANYLGAGAYEHHVPALVGAVCSKSEFLTAYTPYQPEVSQGMLQAIFEYQSALCALTGLDVANASVYDGASACAEALLMALRHRPERQNVVIAGSLHPHYRAVVDQYLASQDVTLITVPFQPDGRIDSAQLQKVVTAETAALLIQSPNFFGVIEQASDCFEWGRRVGAINILCANPLAYGLFASAADLGAHIAVGDTQPLGLSLQFGGPYVGYMVAEQELLRQMPGRIVGETVDAEGRRGFVLTLQAREQHIRREKATSNICTNQALAALASLVAILWYGPQGLHKLALTNYQRAAYLKHHLKSIPGVRPLSEAPTFNEFVIQLDQPVKTVIKRMRRHDIEPGLELGRYFPSMKNGLLVAVTETKTQQQLDQYVAALRHAMGATHV